jgi:uridine kinase
MDDFFLRPEQRTPQRFAEPCGNIDYERFMEEVLTPLKEGRSFSFRPFDCSTNTLASAVPVSPKKLNFIEGSYSLHPYFGEIYDLKVFLSISPKLQQQRILQRPTFLHNRFFEEWIPMEQRYFTAFDIPATCQKGNRHIAFEIT